MQLGAVAVLSLVLLHTTACGKTGRPARITAGVADTVVVNNMRPVHLPVQVHDVAGHLLPDSAVRYTWVSGEPMTISAAGIVVCSQRSDAVIRATLSHLSSLIAVRCRPVAAVRFPGALEVVIGDTARAIPFAAYGPDHRPVEQLAARVWVRDSNVLALDGIRVQGRTSGTTLISITIGDHGATSGVRVYAPATSLDGLQAKRSLIAVPVSLARGDMRRWSLPAGGWILSMLPPQDEELGLKLRVEGARCEVLASFGPRRYGCMSNQTASVVVYAPWKAGSGDTLTGMLAVKPDAESVGQVGTDRGAGTIPR
jgi:hypothetical protein